MLSAVLRIVAIGLVYALVLFAAAGTAAWTDAWVYLAAMTLILLVYTAIVVRSPGLVAERSEPPADAKRWDKPLVAVIGVVAPIAMVLLAGLDHRWGWTGPKPRWWSVTGLVVFVAGGMFTNWAVATNRFFSAVVRIQRDRGHRVVDGGPYGYVRHPGYLGSIVYMVGAGMALTSTPVLWTAAITSLIVCVRTAMEDRALRAELDGYAEYAQRVRWRLFPGLW